MKRILLLVLLLTLPNLAFAKNLEAKQLQTLSQKAGWQASDVWFKGHAQNVKQLLGLQNPPDGNFQFEAPNQMRSKGVPSVYDWRDVGGVNYVSPVLNQGNCGSCVSFATVATFETQMNVALFGSDFRFSTQSLFSCGGGMCQYGWAMEPAAQYVQNTGIPDESCLPYTSGADGKNIKCAATCANAEQRSVRAASYSQPTSYMKNLDALRKALLKGPLLTGMTVYSDFLFYKSGVYKHVTGSKEGGHAISIVGYDDQKNALIIRNSWGTDWGMNGFAYVSYDDVSGIGNETWAFEPPRIDGFVVVRNPINKKNVSGVTTFQTEATFANLSKVELTVVDSLNRTKTTLSCTQAKCDLPADTASWADGRYEVYATAKYGSNNSAESQHEYFYVMNQTPDLKLSFDGQDVNLSAPLSDRVVFNIHSQSGVSPLSTVTLMVRSGGFTVYSKATDTALPEMTLGWRTPAVPNGNYEIYLVGTLKINDQIYTTESNHFNVTVSN